MAYTYSGSTGVEQLLRKLSWLEETCDRLGHTISGLQAAEIVMCDEIRELKVKVAALEKLNESGLRFIQKQKPD